MNWARSFDSKYLILDEKTPLGAAYSGKHKRSYAYENLQNRLPVMLTNIIDHLSKDKDILATKYGEKSREELKEVIGLISRLKYELQTDKPLEVLHTKRSDRELWNSFIGDLPSEANSYYKICWLHAECYVYRKLNAIFESSASLSTFDFFGKIKQVLLQQNLGMVLALSKSNVGQDSYTHFERLLKQSLWTNRNELYAQTEKLCPLTDAAELMADLNLRDQFIIISETRPLWEQLRASQQTCSTRTVDIVCGNSGVELFADCLLAEFMIVNDLATKVRFHVKSLPWFVLDATQLDFHWLLNYLNEQADTNLQQKSRQLRKYLQEGVFEIAPEVDFWTLPLDFSHMKAVAPELYVQLSKSLVIIFKGNLNYRKLLGDRCLNATTDLNKALNEFHPSNVCAIRTLKSEVLCGLEAGAIDELDKRHPGWMTDGNFGIIQFAAVQSDSPHDN